jgi:hypothetical protein
VDVKTIMANLKSQALVGNTGAADDDDRLLRYLNKAYAEVYAFCAQLYPNMYQKFQDMEITAGIGAYSYPSLLVLSVVDKNNATKVLDHVSVDDIEASDPGLEATGTPTSYDYLMDGLITYPLNTTTLQLRYVPQPLALTADSLESAIKIPAAYHGVLEWATLWTIAYDERDKMVGTELQLTKDHYDELKESLRLFILSQRPRKNTRVKAIM